MAISPRTFPQSQSRSSRLKMGRHPGWQARRHECGSPARLAGAPSPFGRHAAGGLDSRPACDRRLRRAHAISRRPPSRGRQSGTRVRTGRSPAPRRQRRGGGRTRLPACRERARPPLGPKVPFHRPFNGARLNALRARGSVLRYPPRLATVQRTAHWCRARGSDRAPDSNPTLPGCPLPHA